VKCASSLELKVLKRHALKQEFLPFYSFKIVFQENDIFKHPLEFFGYVSKL